MASMVGDLIASLQNCLFCFPSTPSLRIAGHSYRMLRLLGEGGFSYVYLVQSTQNAGQLYALKKIRCPFGQESVAQALKEVEAYSLFKGTVGGEYIIEAVGHEVRDEAGRAGTGFGDDGNSRGGNKTVYVLLPYYRKGNLQDAINANLVNHTRFGERRLMQIMLGVCKGLRAMHNYHSGGSSTQAAAKVVRAEAEEHDRDAKSKAARNPAMTPEIDLEEEQGQAFLQNQVQEEVTGALKGTRPGQIRSYAHRDIKPANIMLDDSLQPILMDLGSLAPAPTPITSRSIALAVQDTAAEHSTMPYRAPELFDVKTGSVVDTKVDIWSLGCTIYACLIGKSPFEARSEETGGSLSICVLGGDWRWPDDGKDKDKGKGKAAANGSANGNAAEPTYPSEGVREIVRRCLMVESGERPDVDELQRMIETVLDTLPADEVDGLS